MSEQQGWAQPVSQAPSPKPKSKPPFYFRPLFWVAAIGVLLVALFVVAAVNSPQGHEQGRKTTATTTAEAPAAPAVPATTHAERYATPKPSDFELTVKETSRTHYGAGVGDSVEYKIVVTSTHTLNYDPDKEYDLTYQVTGGEDGPQTNTITIQGDQYEDPGEELVDTHANVKLRAKILSLTEA